MTVHLAHTIDTGTKGQLMQGSKTMCGNSYGNFFKERTTFDMKQKKFKAPLLKGYD